MIFLIAFAGEGGWLNYPGFEAWKFANLFLFIAAAIFLHHRFGKPIAQNFKARGERIRFELERARKEQDEAKRKLAEVEARLQDLDVEIARTHAQALAEVEGERKRIMQATEFEIKKLREQALREIATAAKAAQAGLRRFTASRSVELAEGLIQKDINSADDMRLMLTSVDKLGSNRI
jgi:F0F1-type ATP synthase membrane subunit b/b'